MYADAPFATLHALRCSASMAWLAAACCWGHFVGVTYTYYSIYRHCRHTPELRMWRVCVVEGLPMPQDLQDWPFGQCFMAIKHRSWAGVVQDRNPVWLLSAWRVSWFLRRLSYCPHCLFTCLSLARVRAHPTCGAPHGQQQHLRSLSQSCIIHPISSSRSVLKLRLTAVSV
jgi:hypothetical protein